MEAGQRLYLWLSGIFVTCLLVADIIGGKLFELDLAWLGTKVVHSVGNLAFPITFVLTDIVNEFYGKRAARQLTYLGLGMAALSFGLIYVARLMPTAAISPLRAETFDAVFGVSNRVYVASLVAYLVGQLLDITVFGVFKRLTKGRMVWLRATGSTLISQAVDTLLVTFILFGNTPHADGSPRGLEELFTLAGTGYVLKFAIAVALTPIIYLLRWQIRTRVGLQPQPA